ncbi:unnamed protein product [Amaranthus hypochondriacus]
MAFEKRDEILVLPFFGQGHLFPFYELIKHLNSLNFATTIFIPSSLSSTIPSWLRDRDFTHIVYIPSSAHPLPPPPGTGQSGCKHYEELLHGIESFLLAQPLRPLCVVIDIMMGWAKDVFKKFDIPMVTLFTSGACSAAMEYGSWKAHVSDLKPHEARILPGLPCEMAVSYSDLIRQAHHPLLPPPPPFNGPQSGLEEKGYKCPPKARHPLHPPSPPFDGPNSGLEEKEYKGPPKAHHPLIPPPSPQFNGPDSGLDEKGYKDPPHVHQQPPWIDDLEGMSCIMMNTCHELEGQFLDYLTNHICKPIWAVGPLLPDEYWKPTSLPVHDQDIRANKQSNHTEQEVIQWLDSKPFGSVLYISFGSEVGPTKDEYAELASALEVSDWPFIWVIQHGYYQDDLETKEGEKGLIIAGWAPQLMILRHPSIGAFLSHCGWNSTLEAIGRGVPILAWPIRGDQHYNAKLIVSYLKVGYMIRDDVSLFHHDIVKKFDIVKGVGMIMNDQQTKQRAQVLRTIFTSGFPASSKVTLSSFRGLFVDKAKTP